MSKKLEDLYNEYKRIKGMADGGSASDSDEVDDSDFEDTSKKSPDKVAKPAAPKNPYTYSPTSAPIQNLPQVNLAGNNDYLNALAALNPSQAGLNTLQSPKMSYGGRVNNPDQNNRYRAADGYDDGGQVEPSAMDNLKQALHNAFNNPTPTPAPSPQQTLDQKYQAIRQQNAANAGYAHGGPITNNGYRTNSYVDGGDVKPDDISGSKEEVPVDDSNDAMIKKYKDLGMLKGPTVRTGEEADISGKADEDKENLKGSPEDLKDVEEKEDPDDKQLENRMANEDFEAGEKSDGREPERKVADDEEKDDSQPAEEDKEDDSDEDDKDESALASAPKPQDRTPAQAPEAPKDNNQQSLTGLLAALKQQPNGLAEAQRQRDLNLARAQTERGAAIMGAGLTGRNVNNQQVLNAIADKEKYANLPVQKYQEQIANQKNDPNSPMSQATRDYFQSKGIKVPDGASASDIMQVAPFYAKDAGLQAAWQRAILSSQTKLQTNANSVDAANARAKDKNQIEKEKADAMREQAQAGREEKQDNKANADFEKMGKLVAGEVASSRSPFGRSANVIRSAEQLEAIGKQYNDKNQLDNRQIAEIARGLDSMLSNGSATVTGAAHLLPKTASGNLASIEEYITSLPAGAQQKEFVKRMMDTVAREKQVAADQVKRTQGHLLASYSHLKQKYPERYAQTLKDMGIPTEEESQSAQSQHKPGDLVQYKGGTYRVGQDGNSLEEVQ